jgi:hypothetical protein
MTGAAFQVMVGSEVRLRLRRPATQVALLVAALVMWLLITDPATGYAMLAAGTARVAYDSTGLALGSSLLATVLLGLFGFFLVRGRADVDLRSGIGEVIAATPVGNRPLLLGRWAGNVCYLGVLALVLALTMTLLQGVRGEGRFAPWEFLGFYLLVLGPQIAFVGALALVWEAVPALMGKRGDGLYFLVWLAQVGVTSAWLGSGHGSSPWLALDMSGLAVVSLRAQELLHTRSLAVGFNPFDPAVAPIVLGHFWTAPMIVLRCASALLAPLPVLLAARLFHRFSPDLVTAGAARRGRAWMVRLNRLLRPLDLLSRPLLALAGRLPGRAGALTAEVAVAIAAHPVTGLLLLLFPVVGATVEASLLPGVVLAAVLCWGIVVADISVRDQQADTAAMSASAVGGRARRYWRQYATAVVLGLLLTGAVLGRWAMADPVRACALGAGILMVAAWAQALGATAGTGRVFTVLFLFGTYLTTQLPAWPALDVLGVRGTATPLSTGLDLLLAVTVVAAGFAYNRRRELH